MPELTEEQTTARTNRIIEFLNYGNLYGARAFLQFLINDSVASGNLGPDVGIDWRAMFLKEQAAGIGT